MNPEGNKNPNSQEALRASNNSVAAPQQTVAGAPFAQQIVASRPVEMGPRKFNAKKAVLWVLAIILITPVALVAGMIALFLIQGSLKMNKLNNHAKGLEKELSSLVFVEGQSINAKGIVEGDAITARDDPAQSTFAEGALDVNKPLASLESEVSANLSKDGFVREGGPEGFYYATRMSGGTYDDIIFRYIKGDEAIRIIYKFDKEYTCPKEYVCQHTPKSKPTDTIYPLSGFGTLTVTRMNINFADKSNDFYAGYLDY